MTAFVTENLTLVAGAPGGILKLRQLILQLAVRGTLVPQLKTEDGAALSLALLAAASKENADGRSRRQKTAVPDATRETLYSLPSGWQWCKLNELVAILNGRAYKKEELLESGTPVLRVGNLFTSKHWYYSDLTLEGDKYCETGDLIFAWSASFGPFIWPGERVIYHYHIWKLRPHDERAISKLYLNIYLQERTHSIKAAGHGVSMAHMTKEKMEVLSVALPPLAEQHRIVAKVDELMALCDRLDARQQDAEAAHTQLVQVLLDSLTQARDAEEFRASWARVAGQFEVLFTTEESVEALRHTVRLLAVRGRLVVRTGDNGSTGTLVTELKEHWRTRSPKRASLGEPLRADGHDAIPRSWLWLRFGFVAETRLGKMLDAAKNTGLLRPYLRNTNVQWERFELHDVKQLRLEDSELNEFRVVAGDLLICEGGEPGRCAVWKDEAVEMYFQKALHRARPLCGIMPEYLLLCLRVDAYSGALDSLFTGATIKHLTGEKLERYLVPIAPLSEQAIIVAEVTRLLGICDSLKARITVAREKHEQLADALVASAITV